MKRGLSDALLLTDYDDYIQPSQVCTQKVVSSSRKTSGDGIDSQLDFEKSEEDGKYYQIHGDGRKSELSAVKEITLADCLTCSSCTTTAEAILVNSQTPEEFEKEAKGKFLVVTVSHESVVSLSNFFNISSNSECMKRIILFFRKFYGAKSVFHLNHYIYMKKLSLELSNRFKKLNLENDLPLLSSHCPGFICYTEKTHGDDVIPYLSNVPSTQAIYGELIKTDFFKGEKDVYHVSIAPCYDKKLEAAREDFKGHTDLVITTGEFVGLLEKNEVKFDELELVSDNELEESMFWETRCNFTEFVIRDFSKNEFKIPDRHEIFREPIKWKKGRNSDFQIYNVNSGGEEGEKMELKCLRINGFRNIQMIIRRLKRRKCKYHFIEVNACPKGCYFGGGQNKPKEDVDLQCFCKNIQKVVDSSPVMKPPLKLIELSKRDFYTPYHDRKASEEEESINW